MKDEQKTKAGLISELKWLRIENSKLGMSLSELRNTEEALRRSEQQLRMALESANEGLWDWDLVSDVMEVTPQWVENLGYTLEETRPYMTGARWKSLTHPDDLPRIREDLIQHFKGQTDLYENVHRMRTKNGEWRWLLDRGRVVRWGEHGRALRAMGTYLDITERKRAEEAMKEIESEALNAGQMASLGELAAGVAHEINNPINSIINLAQILVNEYDKATTEYDLGHRIMKEGERIASIVSGLLSFASSRDFTKKPIDVSEVLSATLGLTEAQLNKNGIILRLSIQDPMPKAVGHFQQLQQVFLNIINNARYALNQRYPGFHPDKLLKIDAREARLNDTHYVKVSLLDKGTGIPQSYLHRVTEPFFSTKPSGMGTGLGLSISHGIIKDHGGKLVIKSRELDSTEVIIYIPVG
ncbi:MAG: PAS domain-containing protein [Deltaproteobacteria bacterium]|nr:PAS domain-containing protein [Deltaproteobacteria bacterium]